MENLGACRGCKGLMPTSRFDRPQGGSVLLSSFVSSHREGHGSVLSRSQHGSVVPGAPLLQSSVASPGHPDEAKKREEESRKSHTTLEAGTPVYEWTESEQRAVWGLYCMYAIVGLIYGFVSNYIQIPICQYIFGPMDKPGRASLQQCNVAGSVTMLPWNFKVFYGFFLDRYSFCGSRRRGWIIFGWTSALIVLGCMAFVAEHLAEDGNFALYMMLQMVMCSLYIFSDVAGDGMTIELSKLEPPERRGWILTTGQLIRFATTCFINIFGILAMNGTSYYPPTHKGGDGNQTIFPFQLTFGQVHLGLVAMALPFWVGMVYLLKDPPQQEHVHHDVREALMSLWDVMKSKVMSFLIIFSLGNMAIASLSNPAANIIASIATPSTLQNSLGTFAGNVLFLIGVWIFRKYFMNTNWRVTFVWTTILLGTNCGFQLLVIYNAWGIGQSGWFYAFGNNLLNLIQGIAQVLSSLAVAEIAPAGSEACLYEFLTTMHNSGITLNANLQNIFVPIFHLSDIAGNYFPSSGNPNPPDAVYNKNMANATYFTLAMNLIGALIFCSFLPKDKPQCHAWREESRWRRGYVGGFNLLIAGSALFFSLVVSMLSAFPATACLQIAGGNGCPGPT